MARVWRGRARGVRQGAPGTQGEGGGAAWYGTANFENQAVADVKRVFCRTNAPHCSVPSLSELKKG